MSSDISAGELSVLIIYNVDPSWAVGEKDESIVAASQLERAVSDLGYRTVSIPIEGDELSVALAGYDASEFIVFNWCEEVPGMPGSESLVAQELESLHFTFTGASSDSLALAQDKCRVKRVLERSGVPTPRWRHYDRPRKGEWDIFPAIVKSANEHCSEGITPQSVVTNEAELIWRIEYVLETRGQMALVEDFIDGREFHVSLWGNGRIEVLPPAEMDFSRFREIKDRLCTYDSKFVPGSLHYEGIQTLLPAPLDEGELHKLEKVCQVAYQKIGCRDYGRIDLRIRDGVFYVLDVNPNADISADASMACAAEVAGYSYGEFGARIIQLAARRHPAWRRRCATSE